MADQLIVPPVCTKVPRKFCISFTIFAELVMPLHSMSNDTVAGTGAMGGMPKLGNPCPLVRLFSKS